jgi:hypothetical protein
VDADGCWFEVVIPRIRSRNLAPDKPRKSRFGRSAGDAPHASRYDGLPGSSGRSEVFGPDKLPGPQLPVPRVTGHGSRVSRGGTATLTLALRRLQKETVRADNEGVHSIIPEAFERHFTKVSRFPARMIHGKHL